MTEYISREEALNFELEIEAKPEDIQAITKGMALYADYIKSIPAADVVERKKGKWKKAYLDHEAFGVRPTVVYCSECHLTGYWEPNFCPNCGAEMKP